MADDDEKDPSLGSRFKDYLRQNPCVRDAAASGLVGKEIEKKNTVWLLSYLAVNFHFPLTQKKKHSNLDDQLFC